MIRATGQVIGCVQQSMTDYLWYLFEVADDGGDQGWVEDSSGRARTMGEAAEDLILLQ